MIDPKDVGELQKALNDAAGKASVLWTTFITFQLYLAIAFGSVTHRDLFLQTPIKLPLLNVDLALVGFFVVAPTLLMIFHFYLFLQLIAFANKAKGYNTLLMQEVPVASDRQYLRQRLDSFLVLQFLAGPKDQRTGFGGLSLRLIVWITLIGTPMLILLQGQVTFLPYHREWVAWLQRAAVLIDLAAIWYFWVRLRSDNNLIRSVPQRAKIYFGVGLSLCVVVFSVYLAIFPGEWLDEHLPEFRNIPTTWPPQWSRENDRTSLRQILFEGAVDEASGRPSSVFSNRLVLTDQNFVSDADKLEKVDVNRSFRGRDLSYAVLTRANLRKADFSGAVLNGARFEKAKLRNAAFGWTNTTKPTERTSVSETDIRCTLLRGASFDGADLRGASLDGADLQGASFWQAQTQGASLNEAQAQDAELDWAEMQGASLFGVRMQRASLLGAQLQGASFDVVERKAPEPWVLHRKELTPAILQGTDFRRAQLQGASFFGALLQGAKFYNANLQGAEFDEAELQDAEFGLADADEKKLERNKYVADLACSNSSPPYVARGLIRNLNGQLSNDDLKSFADQLRKGIVDPTACPGIKGFTDEDWYMLSKLEPRD